MVRTCPCGFEAPPNVDPTSAEWHRGHRDAHMAKYPNLDDASKAALDQLVAFAEREEFVPRAEIKRLRGMLAAAPVEAST